MAILGVDDFKAKLSGGGARANLFKATVMFPGYAGGDVELTSFMIKGAQLPASVISPIIVPFRGRQFKVAGDRTFEPWNIVVLNDTTFKSRDAFERWMNGINQHQNNTGLSNPADYMADMLVEQLDKGGNVIKTYDFRSCWPSMVGAIDLSWNSENEIEEFQVTMEVQYWEANTTS